MLIKKETLLNDLIRNYPVAEKYLSEKTISCIKCGEPFNCTLEEAARESGYSPDEINQFVRDLNKLYDQKH